MSKAKGNTATMKKIRSRALTLLTALAAVTGVALAGLPATPAAAANYCTLRINPADNEGYPGYYWVIVEGETSLGPASSGDLSVTIYGDDEWFDDFVTSWGDSTYGYHFVSSALVWHGDLDEDWEGQDEIYAKVTRKLYTGAKVSFTTSNIRAYF